MTQLHDLRIALTLYNLRDFCRRPADIAETLGKVKAMGYNTIQISGIGEIAPKEMAKILDGEGLQVCCTHTDLDRIRNETDAVIEEHKLWWCRHVGVGALPNEMRNREGYEAFAREGSELGARLAEAGLDLIYHNHSFEFEKYGGRTGLEILYDDSDPATFRAEIDTYWVQHGGGDPAEWIARLAGRIPVLHCKDMGRLDGEHVYLEVGEGNLNWPRILDAAVQAGVEYCVFEQDISQHDPFESARISLANMREMGLTT